MKNHSFHFKLYFLKTFFMYKCCLFNNRYCSYNDYEFNITKSNNITNQKTVYKKLPLYGINKTANIWLFQNIFYQTKGRKKKSSVLIFSVINL